MTDEKKREIVEELQRAMRSMERVEMLIEDERNTATLEKRIDTIEDKLFYLACMVEQA